MVTSGGTSVSIDPVRRLTNSSTGRFGADLTRSLLGLDVRVDHLVARSAIKPYEATIDLRRPIPTDRESIVDPALAIAFQDRYEAFEFVEFDEYADRFDRLLRERRYDLVISVAAVADYGPTRSSKKISSDQDELIVRCRRLPKVIDSVKRINPAVKLIGFKLTAGCAAAETIAAAERLLARADCDWVVANRSEDIIAQGRRIYLVDRSGPFAAIDRRSTADVKSEFKNRFEPIEEFVDEPQKRLARLIVDRLLGADR